MPNRGQSLMVWLCELLGWGVILYCVRDIFHTIFHPVGTGAIGEQVGRAVWRIFSYFARNNHERLAIAGPLAMSAVIFAWLALITAAFTLIYLPFMPDYFVFINGINPQSEHGFLSALYASLVTVTTLGYGDIAPRTHWFRLAAPIEGVLGIALFTASVSWVLSTYPVINRRRSLANQLHLLREMEQRQIDPLDADESFVGGMILGIATEILTIRTDVLQFPITYYFHAIRARDELAEVIVYADELAGRAMQPRWPNGTRISGRLLSDALRDFANIIGPKFLARDERESKRAVLEAFHADHMGKHLPSEQEQKRAA